MSEETNHIDGNKKNNNYKNLEWVTHRENMIHARKNTIYTKKSKSDYNPDYSFNKGLDNLKSMHFKDAKKEIMEVLGIKN